MTTPEDIGISRRRFCSQNPRLVASFARGLARDHLAVRAAIATAWSNAQAEGHINKPKLVKRQMYGREKLDLLQARLVGLDT